MSWNLKKEIKRKALHFLTVFFIVLFVLVSQTYGKRLALFSLVALLIMFLEVDYFRVELGKNIPIIGGMWRKKENKSFGGQVFFLIGTIIALSVFEFNIALAAILMAILGDLFAAVIGKRFGRIWVAKDRALEGVIAEFVVDIIIAYFFIGNWMIILPMALTATLVETLVYKLDDNLLIPVFAGFVGQLLSWVL